ncbi:hypothetical protein HPB47_026212, partial [Ixodes persulcatus]
MRDTLSPSKGEDKQVPEVVEKEKPEENENLVVVHAGLNDALKVRGHNLGKQIEAGVSKLSVASEEVHILMCTIPEVERQSGTMEMTILEANGRIRLQADRLGYDVMEVNKEVYQSGPLPAFDREGTYAEAAARGAAPPLKASVGTQYSPRDFECSTSPPTPSEASVGSQTPAAPPKPPHSRTMPHRLGPKPRVVLDTTPSQGSAGPSTSSSQLEEEAME